MTPMDDQGLKRLMTLAETATPGPRRWEINLNHKSVTLNGGDPKGGFGRYDLDIMQFCRWGMRGATVRFRNERDIMQNAEVLAARSKSNGQ